MSGPRRAEELYHSALERPEEEREAFLADACGADRELLDEVRSLLGYAEQARRLMDGPVADAATPKLAVAPGTRFGPYEIRERIGAGGMGEVYRARDTRLGREAAVKVLPDSKASDPGALARFEREAHLIAALSHPHICTLYDVGRHEGVDYLVMELLEGETLAERLARGPLPVEQALRVGVEIAEALEAAHARGIVHRDIKPGNVIVSPSGHVKVMDFGLARGSASEAHESEATTVSAFGTREGVILGTAAYMSPEQVRGQPVDARADVWALGCVLYEALSGRRAFGGGTISDTLAAVLDREIGWDALPAATPPGVRALLRRCLTRDPEGRLHHVADARIELEDAIGSAKEPLTPGSGRPWWRRPWLPGAAVLVAAVGAWWGLGTRPPASPDVERSIAVLPLVMQGGAGDDAFSTGLTEDIVTHLTKIPDLKVASSRSSLRYKKTEKSLVEIGQELGVATLLVGNVRRQADRVRVNVQLIEASTNQNLWAELFDRPMDDIFAIQSDIAEELAALLEVELSAETERNLARAPTVDPEAYELVLRARHLRNLETRESMPRAAEYFEQATELDPDYALAWAGLAEVLSWQGLGARNVRSEYRDRAARAADRAIELDDRLAEAHLSKGIILIHHPPRDEAAGERTLRRAIELAPRLSNAHRELGLLLLRKLGRVEEGLDALILADEAEPFWWVSKGNLAEGYAARGDVMGAMETLREYHELGPSYEPHVAMLSSVVLQRLEETERFSRQLVDEGGSTRSATLYLALNGRTDEAAAVARDLTSTWERGVAGFIALLAGHDEAAARHYEEAIRLSGGPVEATVPLAYSRLYSDFATLLGYAYQKLGDEAEALRVFAETERYYTDRIARGDTSFQARVGLAAVHALRGDEEAAYGWLQQSIDAGLFAYAELRLHPCFESLRGQERFQRMMAGLEARMEEVRRRVRPLE